MAGRLFLYAARLHMSRQLRPNFTYPSLLLVPTSSPNPLPSSNITTILPPPQTRQTRLTHLNFDSRGVSDACLLALLPLGPGLSELDLSGGRITSRGAALLAHCFRRLQVLDLCGGHITGRPGGGRGWMCVAGVAVVVTTHNLALAKPYTSPTHIHTLVCGSILFVVSTRLPWLNPQLTKLYSTPTTMLTRTHTTTTTTVASPPPPRPCVPGAVQACVPA